MSNAHLLHAGAARPRPRRRADATRALGLVLGLLLGPGLGLGCQASRTAHAPAAVPALAPPPGVRVVAEWEPAAGAVVTFPFEVPIGLVKALAEQDVLYVLVAPQDQGALRQALRDHDLPRRRVRTISAGAGSPYTRDFGPHQIELADGRVAVLDQVFHGYPFYPATARRDRVDAELGRYPDRRADDRVPEACAAYFDAPRYLAPFFLTGGNFLVDGRGTVFFTDALVDENAPWYTQDELFELLRTYTGATRFVHLPNVEEIGIQHVDCWLKVLPGNRLLVQRAPADHPQHTRLEAAVEELRAVRDASGAPFEILRIDCPIVPREPWGTEAPLAAYTNSLVLNGRVHVPLYGVPGDEIALATWRAAMPEHEVLGHEFEDWQSFDALHCRTRAIFAGLVPATPDPKAAP